MMRREYNARTILMIAGVIGLLLICNQSALAGKSPASANMQTFTTYKYIDPMTGMEAFRLLIPKGWRAEGGIKWSANPALPAQSRFRFYNPMGSEEFNLFPTQTYFWTNNRTFLSTNPQGSLRFGSVVAQPIGLHAVFTSVIIPGAKKNATGLNIRFEKDVPELAALARGAPVAGLHAQAEAGKIRIDYQENGKQIEEEIYAAVSQFVINMPASGYSGPYFINYWYVDDVFSFKDEKGKLDSHTRLFQTMIYSLKINPQWFAKVVNVKEMLAQRSMQNIKAIGHIGEMVAKAGSKMREDQQRDWERRQQVQDKIAQNFSDHIRGVERYHDPRAGKEVELPAGYGNAWSNNLGEYIVTESPGYNPNVGSNLHWEQLTPAK
jgi:hypothetical protein